MGAEPLPESMTVEPSSLSGSLSGNSSVLVAAVLAVFVVGWAATNLVLLGGEGSQWSSRTKVWVGGGGLGSGSPLRRPGARSVPG